MEKKIIDDSFNKSMNYLYEIVLERARGGKSKTFVEYVVANDLEKVLSYLNIERQDLRVNIVRIEQKCSILKVL